MKLKPIKEEIITLLKELCKPVVQQNSFEEVSFEVYGSYATGLSIDTSDVDLLINYQSKEDLTNYLIGQLYIKLKESNKFSTINPILSARVPVLKLEFSLIENQPTRISQIFDETKIDVIKVDISFHNSFNDAFIPAVNAVSYINNALSYYFDSKKLIMLIKKYLAKLNLNSYFNGGLSSYSIFILLFALIRIKTEAILCYKNSYVAPLLVYFLEFYSKFDFTRYGVNLNMNYPFFYLNFTQYGSPVIIDPITNLNIGNGSYRIEEVQNSFSELIQSLRTKYCENIHQRKEKESLLKNYE